MLYHIWYNMCMNDSLKILPARFFKTASGTEPVREWLKDLDKDDSRIIGGGIRKKKKRWALRMAVFFSPKKDREPFGGRRRLSKRGSARCVFFFLGGGVDFFCLCFFKIV